MATRKEFYLLQLKWEGKIGRNSVMGGTIVGDYIQSEGERTIVVKMPKVEKKAGKKKAKSLAAPVNPRPMNAFVDHETEVTHG